MQTSRSCLFYRFAALPWLAASCSDAPSPDAPTVEEAAGPPAPGEDGATCQSDDECFGATCLTELESGLPGGYCTQLACGASSCMGGRCTADGFGAGNTCVDTCTSAADCRSGYECGPFGTLEACVPMEGEANDVGESSGGSCLSGCTAGDPLRIDCGFLPSRIDDDTSQWGLPYDLTQGVDGFALSVWSTEGEQIDIRSIAIGSLRLDLKGDASSLNVTSFFDNPFATVTFPFSPDIEPLLAEPSGLLQVRTLAESLCISRSEGLEGVSVNLELYLVGAGGLTIDSISVDPDVQTVLDELDRLFGLAGISLGTQNAREVKEEAVERYRIIRETDDIRGVLALTQDPTTFSDDPSDSVFSINVMLVDDIAFSDGSEVVGQTAQLPGPPGLHGFGVSGVIVETASLRDSPAYIGLVLAHEMSHFLGLRHTSEVFTEEYVFGRVDPLSDTPECDDVAAWPEACPDYQNLMFPLAPLDRDSDQIEVSEEQGYVLRRNPSVR